MSNRPGCGVLTTLLVSTLGAAHVVQAQTTPEQIVHLAPGVVVAVSMEGAHDTSTRRTDVGMRARDGELHRLLVDQDDVARFAYVLSVEPDGDGAAMVVRPVRLHETVAAYAPGTPGFVLPFRLDGPVATLDTAQTSGRVHAGDVMRLDTVEHRETGTRVTDVIRVVEMDPAAVQSAARRRAASMDAEPTLSLVAPTVRRDGTVVGTMGGLASGRALILAVPDAGTLVLRVSAADSEPATSIATVDGRTVRFSLDGHDWEATADEAIAPPDVTALWVYRLGGWFSPMGTGAPGLWIGAGDGDLDRMRKNFDARLPLSRMP